MKRNCSASGKRPTVTKPLWVLDTDHLSLLQRAHPQVVARLRSLPLEQRATTIVNAEEQLRGRFAMIARARQQVGTQDLKIAAIVLSVSGVLVTRNQRDFAQIPNLVIADWTQPNE